jgi:hypothetical protein
MTEFTVVAPTGLEIQIREDCECAICRRARGLEPLTTSQLKERREAKR